MAGAAEAERWRWFQPSIYLPSRPIHSEYCASALSRAMIGNRPNSPRDPLPGPTTWEHLLSAEELTPSCGLGLLCASNVEACAAEITRQSRPVVWALVLGSHEWAAGYFYTQATTSIEGMSKVSLEFIYLYHLPTYLLLSSGDRQDRLLVAAGR